MPTEKKYKILLSGGGTGGSVSPLLAVAEEISRPDSGLSADFLWLGTKDGLEANMVGEAGIAFRPIRAGKLRRYFDWRNFRDPFLIIFAFFESLLILWRWRPDLILTAGSFVSVPTAVAGWLFGIPVIAHQQDVVPGLANKIMAKFAKAVTVTFEKSLNDFGQKAIWTGNPVKIQDLKSRISDSKPLSVILVLGGGSGALAINRFVADALEELAGFSQVIHQTGKNKNPGQSGQHRGNLPNYKSFEFLNREEMARVYASADIVISRAGMGVLTELAFLKKPAIIIPMPCSHQEANAAIFGKANAAIVLGEKNLTSAVLVENIKKLLADENLKAALMANLEKIMKPGAKAEYLKLVKKYLNA